MLIFCSTQTTVEKQYFSAMKKCIAWNSARTWVTKIVKHHSLVCQQPSAYCTNTCERMLRHRLVHWMIVECEYCALTDAVRGLRVVRNSTENLRQLVTDKAATWVSEHCVQKAAFMRIYCRYTVHRQNFADIILGNVAKFIRWFLVVTLRYPAAFGDFRKKKSKRMWLCARISAVQYALQTR